MNENSMTSASISVSGYAEDIIPQDTLLSFSLQYKEEESDIATEVLSDFTHQLEKYNLGSGAIKIGSPLNVKIPPPYDNSEIEESSIGNKNNNRQVNIINTPDGPILKYSDFHAQQDVTVLIPATLESTVSTEIYSIIEQIFTKGNFGAALINKKNIASQNSYGMEILRKKAIENGKRNAEEVAKLLGGKIGELVSYSEEGSNIGIYKSIMMQYNASTGGDTKNYLNVHLTYKLEK